MANVCLVTALLELVLNNPSEDPALSPLNAAATCTVILSTVLATLLPSLVSLVVNSKPTGHLFPAFPDSLASDPPLETELLLAKPTPTLDKPAHHPPLVSFTIVLCALLKLSPPVEELSASTAFAPTSCPLLSVKLATLAFSAFLMQLANTLLEAPKVFAPTPPTLLATPSELDATCTKSATAPLPATKVPALLIPATHCITVPLLNALFNNVSSPSANRSPLLSTPMMVNHAVPLNAWLK